MATQSTISPELATYINQSGVRPDYLTVDEGYGTVNVDALNKIAQSRQDNANNSIVSSSSVLDQRDADNARSNAGSNMYNQYDTGGLNNLYLNNYNTGLTENRDLYDTMYSAVEQVYDSKLAQSNSQYKNAMQDLESMRQRETAVARQNALSLNPYAEARGAQTEANFLGAINDRYSQQAARLTQQADLAQQALAAGQAEAYANLMNQMTTSNQKFRADMLSFMQDQQKMQQQQSQWQAGYNLDVAKYGLQQDQFSLSQDQYQLSKETKASDDFRAWMDRLSGSPEIQSEIENYLMTGQITEGLMPIIQTGQQFGLSPRESMSIFKYQTDSVRKQDALESYRANQQYLATMRLANAQESETLWQRRSALIGQLNLLSDELKASGINPGTREYTLRMSQATSGGAPIDRLDRDAINKYGSVMTELEILRGNLNNLAKDSTSPLWQTLRSYLGTNAKQFAEADAAIVDAQIEGIAGIFAKTFGGEAGVLAQQDVARAIGTLPRSASTEQMRMALFNAVAKRAEDGMVRQVNGLVSGGVDTTLIGQDVDSYLKTLDTMKYGQGETTIQPLSGSVETNASGQIISGSTAGGLNYTIEY